MNASSASYPPRPLLSLPARDAASHFLRAHADGAPLYPAGSFASDAAVERRARKLEAWTGDRAALAAWLKEQNASETSAPLHAAQAQSLADAGRPDALFVLTGQQPGLLGGPALALYKAMTAVAWARSCARRLNRPVIPVFWAAGDDSDLAESNAVEFLEPDAARSASSVDFPDAQDALPMSLRMPAEESLRRLRQDLPAAWSAETRAAAEAAYFSGTPRLSLTQAFLRLMQSLLGAEGVLFVDGFSAAQRPAAQALLGRIAADSGKFHEALARGTKRLKDTLNQPPQVPVRPGTVPVFLLENDRRERLFASDSGRVYAAGEEHHDLRPQLSQKVLLHSALTRPLVVEELFPTLGHVLGPAELRYFAQIADVFPAFGHAFPLVAPRQQALVLDARDWERLQGLGFRAEDLFDLSPSLARARLAADAWKDHPAAEAFPEEAYKRFQEELRAYQARWFPATGFESPTRRLDRSFGNYREQARRQVFEQTGADTFRALQPLLRWLGNGVQDRHLNVLSLRAALGEKEFEALKAFLGNFGSPGISGGPVTDGAHLIIRQGVAS